MDPSFIETLPEAHDQESELVGILRRFFERVKYASGDFSISAAAAQALEELNDTQERSTDA